MYDGNYTLILLNESYVPNPLWPTKTCQHGWEFNYSDVPYATVATKVRQEIFNLQLPLFDCFLFLSFYYFFSLILLFTYYFFFYILVYNI